MAGTLTVSTLSDGTNSGSATDAIKGSARAFVNFNATGTVAIRAGYNVSSITDDGTGRFRVNFTNAMADVNYSCATNQSRYYDNSTTNNDRNRGTNVIGQTTTYARLMCGLHTAASYEDFPMVSFVAFR
jgi:hypothetical protein